MENTDTFCHNDIELQPILEEAHPLNPAQTSQEQSISSTASRIENNPSNANGSIVFSAKSREYRKPAKFYQLSVDTAWDSIRSKFVDNWKLTSNGRPQFVVHVIGSESAFRMSNSTTKDIFSGGLMKAIRSTQAWLITDGLNVGASMAVGKAVFENQIVEFSKDGNINRSIECIGIMPWGRVKYRDDLKNTSDKSLHSINYCSDETYKPGNVSLEPNHTHFLMVDDGHRNRSYIEGQFIAKLLKNIEDSLKPQGFKTPVLSLLVEGDLFSLRCMVDNLVAKVPVLVCKGTGRAADLVADMRQYYLDKKSDLKLKKMKGLIEQELKAWLNSDSNDNGRDGHIDSKLTQLSQNVAECIWMNTDLIYIFDASVSDPRELDSALLSCILNSKRLDMEGQLNLAQQWNRSDVAENQILRQHNMYTQRRSQFYPFLTDALVNEQLEFVKMYFEYGVQAQMYLTVAQLRDLYKRTVHSDSYLGHMLSTHVYNKKKQLRKQKNEQGELHDIFMLIRKFTRRYRNKRYEMDTGSNDHQNDSNFEQPFQELLIWAILVNKPELANYFCENAEMPLLCAIVGTLLAKRMADSFRSHGTDIYDNLLFIKRMLESFAIGLINEAFIASPEKSCELLRETSFRYGDQTCLDMAAFAEDEAFLATPCCQLAISRIWRPKFDVTPFGTVMSTVFGFPIFIFVKFGSERRIGQPAKCIGSSPTKPFSVLKNTKPDGNQVDGLNAADSAPEQLEMRNPHPLHRTSSIRVEPTTSDNSECLSPCQKIVKFYTSPISKFTLHTIFYIAFLVLFAYVLLFGFRWRMTVAEIVLHIWILTLFLEEVRIFINYPARTLRLKLADWWHFSLGFRIDYLTTILSILTFVLRWFATTFAAARLALVINFAMYLLKVFKIHLVNGYLGPKVIMIKHMGWALVSFLLVLVVFFLSYTIGSIALIHPGREFTGFVFIEIFKMGTWEIFGQLNDETYGGPTATCHMNKSHSNEYNSTADCNTWTWPVPVMLAVYLFFGNILLINMLIAIFAHIFEKVQTDAKQIWKYQIFFLVEEYWSKPFLPAPFIILQHGWMLKNYILKHCCSRKNTSHDDTAADKESTNRTLLSAFEQVCRDDYLYNQRRMESDQIDHVIKDILINCTKLTEHYAGLNTAGLQNKRDVVFGKQTHEGSLSKAFPVRRVSTM